MKEIFFVLYKAPDKVSKKTPLLCKTLWINIYDVFSELASLLHAGSLLYTVKSEKITESHGKVWVSRAQPFWPIKVYSLTWLYGFYYPRMLQQFFLFHFRQTHTSLFRNSMSNVSDAWSEISLILDQERRWEILFHFSLTKLNKDFYVNTIN